MTAKEMKLCENCPLPHTYKKVILERFEKKQYIKAKEKLSKLQECRERRLLLKKIGWIPCPHYKETENIAKFSVDQEKVGT